MVLKHLTHPRSDRNEIDAKHLDRKQVMKGKKINDNLIKMSCAVSYEFVASLYRLY